MPKQLNIYEDLLHQPDPEALAASPDLVPFISGEGRVMACDAFCANHGCNQGPGCAARDDRHTDRKPMHRTANAIEYTLLKAHQLTADEIGAATGYPANVVKRGLAELAAGQLAHKAKDDQREVWRWGRAPNGAMTPTPAVAARGTYQSEPHPATLARPGGQDAYRLPSRGACDGGRP